MSDFDFGAEEKKPKRTESPKRERRSPPRQARDEVEPQAGSKKMIIGVSVGVGVLLVAGIVAYVLLRQPRGVVETPNAPQNVEGQTYRVHFVDGVFKAKPVLVTTPKAAPAVIHYALHANANAKYSIKTPTRLSLHYTVNGPGIQEVKGLDTVTFVAPQQAEYRISVYSTQHIWPEARDRTEFDIAESK